MKNVLSLLVLGMFVIGCSVPAFAETTDTSSRPQGPQFEKKERPQMNRENSQKGQFNVRRPKYKPDSQPGGKIEPKEWEDSSDSNLKNEQPPKLKEGLKNGLKEGLKNGLVNGDKKSE